jgi:hypothetical protein
MPPPFWVNVTVPLPDLANTTSALMVLVPVPFDAEMPLASLNPIEDPFADDSV